MTKPAVKLNARDKAVVKGQYEALPYPPRDPADEDKRLITTALANFMEYAQFALGGREPDWDSFRVLDAGGGTGDATVYAAEQLRGTKGEVVYLDFTAASREVAEARVARRKLGNVRFVSGSILDIDTMDLGQFDLIVSSGVLHHLVEPTAGLKQLVKCLKPKGMMGIMVYGTHGRYPIYPTQDLLRRVMPEGADIPAQLEVGKLVIDNLAQGHPLYHPVMRNVQYSLAFKDDAELLDLFLHNQDRAYTVPEVVAWVGEAEAEVVEPFGVMNSRFLYDVASYWQKPELLKLVEGKTALEKAAIAELIGHAINRHSFFAKHKGARLDYMPLDDAEAVPCITQHHAGMIKNLLNTLGDKTDMMVDVKGQFSGGKFLATKMTRPFLKIWDGKKTRAEMVRELMKEAGVTRESAEGEVNRVLEAFLRGGQLGVRHVSARFGRLAKNAGV